MLVDMGGGSMQIIHFRDRSIRKMWILPLGALRLNGRFLTSDPPAPVEVHRLTKHVKSVLTDASLY